MRVVMWSAVAVGIFLAFGWPFVVSTDPSDPLFRVLAIGTVVALLASIAALLFLRARRPA